MEFWWNECSFCAQGLNLACGDLCFSNFSKKLVKMVKLCVFDGILWYFEKGHMDSLWVNLGHLWFFCEKDSQCSAKKGKCDEMFSKREEMLWNVQQKKGNAMKCSAKEGKCYEIFRKNVKCYEIFSNRGKLLWNVQQKRENAVKCSAIERKCYEMFRKKRKMLRNIQQKRENAMKCSEKKWECYWMIRKRGKMLWNVQQKKENAKKCLAI